MYHQEITIPINRDNRNFEQRRKDMFNNLESKTSTQSSTACTTVATKNNFVDNDIWDKEILEWVGKSKSSWDDEIANIRRKFFCLEPNDDFDDFGTSDTTHHAVTSYSQKITTTTADGKTHTSETSKSFQTSGGAPAVMDRPYLHQNTLSSTDFFKDAYELADDKQVHFKVRLDTTEFKPEDLKVTAQDNKITIKARKENQTANEKSFREFSRTVTVPPSVDIQKFMCNQTKDGILILEAPLKQQENLAITLKDGLGVKAISDKHSSFSNALVTVTGKAGPVVVDDAIFGKKIHLEITVDKDYQPNDFSVYTELNKIHIKGRHETKTATSSSFKEFSRYYEVPETLDPMSVSFHLLDGTLVVEAPLLRSV